MCPRGLHDGQLLIAQLDHLAVLDNPIYLDRLERHLSAEMRIAETPIFQNGCVAGSRPHLRADHLLDLGERGRMVPMSLHRQQDLDVLQPKAQRLDIPTDQRRRVVESRIDQEVPLR